jgi:hypothetical protein
MGSGYRTFTAGEVLTASNVQNFLQDQVVMVFADSTARATSIGTANFEEGMVSYLENSDTVEVYNGTTWGSIAPVSSQGLTLINTTTFSGVTSISLNDVFSATYDNYKVYLNITNFTATPSITIRMRASGSDNSSSNYRYTGVRIQNTNGAQNNSFSNGDTYFPLIGSGTGGTSIFASLEFLQPFASQRTSYSTNAFPQGGFSYMGNGRMSVDTSYDGLTFISDDNNIAGNINVYGLAK